MMAETPKGVPPVTPKQKSMTAVSPGVRADTGGDPYDRSRGNYSKSTENKSKDDPFSDY